jgi:hypothetical protein
MYADPLVLGRGTCLPTLHSYHNAAPAHFLASNVMRTSSAWFVSSLSSCHSINRPLRSNELSSVSLEFLGRPHSTRSARFVVLALRLVPFTVSDVVEFDCLLRPSLFAPRSYRMPPYASSTVSACGFRLILPCCPPLLSFLASTTDLSLCRSSPPSTASRLARYTAGWGSRWTSEGVQHARSMGKKKDDSKRRCRCNSTFSFPCFRGGLAMFRERKRQ